MFEYMGSHLYLGDSTDKGLFVEPFIDITITSPPYNLNISYENYDDDRSYKDYLDFCAAWMKNVFEWSKPNARFCLNVPLDTHLGGSRFLCGALTQVALDTGWKYKISITWNKNTVTSRTAWGSWMSPSAPMIISPVEMILVFYKQEWKREDVNNMGTDLHKDEFIAWTNGLWVFGPESAKRVGHPVPFPIELPHRLIKMFSWKGDTVFDPFTGSGTTFIAAHNLSRKFVGVELSQKYFDLAVQRISKEAHSLF